jgi:mono/diheme cytochrome c family protein
MAVQRIYKRMVLRILSIVLLAGLVSCGNDSEQVSVDENKPQKPLTIEETRTVYTLNCASCHGGDGALKASEAADLTKSEMDDAAIRQTILKGNDKGMMPYEEMLTSREVEGLVEFVKSLRLK